MNHKVFIQKTALFSVFMDWEKLAGKHDKKNVLDWMRSFPDQIVEAVFYGRRFKPKKRKIGKVVACGMGGSGVGAAILKGILRQEMNVPFETYNSYSLPGHVDRNTLVLCVSFSGNTEETLACAREAKRKKAYVVAVTTGGKLAKEVKDHIIVPKRSPQPRMGSAYLILPCLIVLEQLLLVENKHREVGEAVDLIKKEQKRMEAKAKELAIKMKGKLPVVYADEGLAAVAYRFRTDVNENAKQFALSHFLPEHNHNEINARLGLEKSGCEVILLRHRNESRKTKKRFSVVKRIMGRHWNITEVELKGKSMIAAALYALQLSSLASYYLSLANGLDPEPVPDIAILKKALA
jgi:glucose/mannose-6-phosphate isomerase